MSFRILILVFGLHLVYTSVMARDKVDKNGWVDSMNLSLSVNVWLLFEALDGISLPSKVCKHINKLYGSMHPFYNHIG